MLDLATRACACAYILVSCVCGNIRRQREKGVRRLESGGKIMHGLGCIREREQNG